MPRVLLVLFAIVYGVRFAWPALTGAGAGGPFGELWLPDGGSSLLLDSDIRYWGVTSATIAALFLYAAVHLRRSLAWVDLIMAGVLVGAAIRTAEIAFVGVPPGPAVVATVFEWLFPILWFLGTRSLRAERRDRLSRSRELAVPADTAWNAFADYAGVAAWHPYMTDAQVVAGGPVDGVGAARDCRFGPRMAIRETVTEWDHPGRRMVIAIDFLEGPPAPLADLSAAVRVEVLPDDRCRVVLSMAFRTCFGPLGTLAEPLVLLQYAGVFEAMLDALDGWVTTGRPPVPLAMPGSGRDTTQGAA